MPNLSHMAYARSGSILQTFSWWFELFGDLSLAQRSLERLSVTEPVGPFPGAGQRYHQGRWLVCVITE